ncbi:inositol monophosphatase [bacterium]|jgi:myo-inositol-1(or 4)-monophosphatase|nr:inositol monophosphatase [bacterium]
MNYKDPVFIQKIEEIVRSAGDDILMRHFGKPMTLHYKDGAGYATDADLDSEKYLIKSLGKLFPQASFCAEESGDSGSGEYQWVIDPIDGTTNFANGIPYFCVSIALAHNDKPVLGMIYSPVLGEFFHAVEGCGSFLNKKPIRVGNKKELKEAVLASVVGEYKKEARQEALHSMLDLVGKVSSIRRMGALALDLAYCACGRLDVIISKGFKWWDIAAGVIIVEEAGGQVKCSDGGSLKNTNLFCIAANVDLQKKLKSFFDFEKNDLW